MKFVISFFLIAGASHASPIRVFFEEESSRAVIVKEIFTGTYHIPEELIAMDRTEDCGQLKGNGKLDLCLKNNGDLIVVSADKIFVNESLRIFHAH